MSQAGVSSITVTYVDDEPDFAAIVANHLERGDERIEVNVQTSAADALEQLREGDSGIDCIVSDYEMPDLDGLEFLEAVREESPDLPFVLFTGRGSEDIASEAISRGVTEYMQKATDPQQFEVLRNRVRNAVEKYQTERQLERTETRYRRLVEQNLTGIYIIQDGDVEYANPKCEEIFGYDQGELRNVSVYDLVAPEDHEKFRRNVEPLVDGEDEERNYTLTGERRNGERFEFEVHSGRIEHEGDPALLGSLVDVTEQRERERELEEYRELVETVGDPMYVLDEDGNVVKANRAMSEMLGYEHDTLVGLHASEFVSDEGLETGRKIIRSYVSGSGDSPETFEVEFRTEAGEMILCEANVTTLKDEEGEFRGTVGVVRVITKRKKRERELEEYETIVETAPDGIFILDDDGRLVSGNQTGAEMVGYDRADIVGRPFSDLIDAGVLDPGVVDQYENLVQKLRSGRTDRKKAKFETQIRPPDGGEQTCEIHIVLLPGENGEFRGTVGVIRDVTERKAIEEALRSERDRISALFENIPEPTVVYEFVDGDPIVRRVNDAFEEGFGYEEQTVLGESIDDYIVQPEVADEAADLDERVIAGEQLDVEIERETASGERRDFLLRNASIPTDDGVQGYAIYTDITERKERERRLEGLHDATWKLMEATSVEEIAEICLEAAERVLGLTIAGFYRHDPDQDVLEPVAVTDRAEELFGDAPTFERGEAIAWRVFESGTPTLADNVRESGDVYNPETPVRSELVLPLGDHGVYMAGAVDAGGFDQLDRYLAQVFVSNVESALDRARRESLLRAREQALLRQNERLEEFAGVVSHDLRSPLTVAKGNVYLARSEPSESYLDKIERALDRMEQLIDDLLSLAQQGDTVDETDLVALPDAAQEAWSTVDTGTAKITVEPSGQRVVEADEGRLRELLENLFGNAVEHGSTSDRQAEDAVDVERPGVTVRLGGLTGGFYVEDDGSGLSQDAKENLFELGFTTEEEGTGFGLSIVKQIAEAHGWTVDAADGTDGGARFEFTDVDVVERGEVTH